MATTNIATSASDCTMIMLGASFDHTDTTSTLLGAYQSSSQQTYDYRAGIAFDFSVLPAGASIVSVYPKLYVDSYSFYDVVPDSLCFNWFPYGPNGSPMDFTDFNRAVYIPYPTGNTFALHTFDDMQDWWADDRDAVPLSLINATGLNTLYAFVIGTDSSGGAGDYVWFRSYEYGGSHAYAPYAKVTYTLPSTGELRHVAWIAGSPRLTRQRVRR